MPKRKRANSLAPHAPESVAATATATATSTATTAATDSKSRPELQYSDSKYAELTAAATEALEQYNRNQPEAKLDAIKKSAVIFPSKFQFHKFPAAYQNTVVAGINRLKKIVPDLKKIDPYNALVRKHNTLVRQFNSLRDAKKVVEKKLIKFIHREETVENIKVNIKILAQRTLCLECDVLTLELNRLIVELNGSIPEAERAEGSLAEMLAGFMDPESTEEEVALAIQFRREGISNIKSQLIQYRRYVYQEAQNQRFASDLVDSFFGAPAMSDEQILREVIEGRAQIVGIIENPANNGSGNTANNSTPSYPRP